MIEILHEITLWACIIAILVIVWEGARIYAFLDRYLLWRLRIVLKEVEEIERRIRQRFKKAKS